MVKKSKRGRSVRNNKNVNEEPDELTHAPHSFVIHKGQTCGFVEDLAKDFRKVMEPFTASSLKEKKNNSIRDFVHVAGILHVTHLCVFSKTDLGVYFKVGKIPRGPTLTFKVENFTLSRDVISSLKKQLVVEEAFKHSPLIVLNNFSGGAEQMKLMASMFQNMFPTLNLQKVDLNTVRRVVLLNYNSDSHLIDFRHYAIKMLSAGISRSVKNFVAGIVPNLSNFEDISEFLTKGGNVSESEAEEDPNLQVTLPQKIASRGNIKNTKSAIKLSELGPRLTLKLIKIEDGLMDGEVMFHDLIHKTDEEKAAIKKSRELKLKLKEKRKKLQDSNLKAKLAQKREFKEKSLKGMKEKSENEGKTVQRDEVEDDDDAEYYREEVGEEPDKELFSKSNSGASKRPPKTFHAMRNKRPKMDQFKGKSNSRSNFKEDKMKSKLRKKSKEKTNAHNRDFRPIGA